MDMKIALQEATKEELINIVMLIWDSSPRNFEEINELYSDVSHETIRLLYRIAERRES
jgi:hypothetical protein